MRNVFYFLIDNLRIIPDIFSGFLTDYGGFQTRIATNGIDKQHHFNGNYLIVYRKTPSIAATLGVSRESCSKILESPYAITFILEFHFVIFLKLTGLLQGKGAPNGHRV